MSDTPEPSASGKGKCRKEGVTYKISCNSGRHNYVAQTADNAYHWGMTTHAETPLENESIKKLRIPDLFPLCTFSSVVTVNELYNESVNHKYFH